MEQQSTLEIIEEGFIAIESEITKNNGRGETTDVHDLLTRLAETIKAHTGMIYDVPCLALLFAQYSRMKGVQP